MKKKVSLKDIADKVGVSIALVSYVLNNQKLDRISKAVAQKIKETAKELNYRTNQVARSLKTRRSNTIGLIVSDISNPFSSTLARIIENEAEQFNYTVIFGSSDENAARSEVLMNIFLNHQVDGLIIAAPEKAEEQLQYLIDNEVPVILVDRYFTGVPVSFVAIDNVLASNDITQHLIDSGRKRIGIITYTSNLNNLLDRKTGYLECLQKNNIPADVQLVKEISLNDRTKEGVKNGIDELLALPDPADSIIFASNVLSLHGVTYLNTLPIRVPDELSIATFDQSAAADLFYAPLTYIKQPMREMGRIAVQSVMDQINQKKDLVQLKLKAELIIRQSSSANK